MRGVHHSVWTTGASGGAANMLGTSTQGAPSHHRMLEISVTDRSEAQMLSKSSLLTFSFGASEYMKITLNT